MLCRNVVYYQMSSKCCQIYKESQLFEPLLLHTQKPQSPKQHFRTTILRILIQRKVILLDLMLTKQNTQSRTSIVHVNIVIPNSYHYF